MRFITFADCTGTDSTFSGNYTRWRIDNRGSGGWYEDEHLLAKTVLAASTGVSLTAAGGSLILNASDVSVSNGNATLQAAGHIRLEAAEEDAVNQITYHHSSRNKLGRKKVYTTEVFNEDLTAVPVAISARDIFLKAGNNIQTSGSQLNAGGNLRLEAGDAIEYYAVRNLQVRQSNTTRTSSFLGVKYDSTRSTNSRSLTSALPTILQSQQDILSNSGGDQLLQGTRVTYGGTASFNAGVGERARADARIILEGLTSSPPSRLLASPHSREGLGFLLRFKRQSPKSLRWVPASRSGPTAPALHRRDAEPGHHANHARLVRANRYSRETHL